MNFNELSVLRPDLAFIALVDDGGAVPRPPVPSFNESPPEQYGGHEEADMLRGVQPFVLDGGVVQRRHMPDPERECVQQPDGDGRCEYPPRRHQCGPSNELERAAPRLHGQDPNEREQRRARRDERRGDEHQELVLYHVGREPPLAPLVQR